MAMSALAAGTATRRQTSALSNTLNLTSTPCDVRGSRFATLAAAIRTTEWLPAYVTPPDGNLALVHDYLLVRAAPKDVRCETISGPTRRS